MRRAALACLAALVALALAAPAAAAPRAAAGAAARFAAAEEAFGALKASARAQRQRQSFTRVLEAYRAVFEKHAGTRQAELALLRAGELHTLLYRWTGQQADLNTAQTYYRRLAQGSPKSTLADDALLAIAYLYLDHFQDPAQAWLKFRDVAELTPDGDKAAEARRQLKRLARYAPPARPAPVEGEPACPTPPSPAGASAAATAPAAPAPPPAAALDQAPAGVAPSPPATETLARVRDIRHWSNPEYSRVVIDLDRKTNFYSNLLEDRTGGGRQPRLYVDLFGSTAESGLCRQIAVNDGILLGVRAGQFTPESVRVVLDIDGLRSYRIFPMQDPFRVVVDVTGGAAAPEAPAAATAPVATAPAPAVAPASAAVRVPAAPAPGSVAPVPVPELIPLPRLAGGQVPAAAGPAPATASASVPAASAPAEALAVSPAGSAPATAPARAGGAPPAAKAAPPAGVAGRAAPAPAGKISLARQLGLGVRRIVVDAGHGAHDPGAPGVAGLQEKEVTLDVALRLRELLHEAGYEVVLTRDRDVYLPLEERTALANTARGDLFVSVHCNASDAGNLSGVETYYLNLASSRRAMATAARENSMAVANMSDLQNLLKEIYSSKMDESSRFAEAVQRSLHATLRRRHRDVKDLGVKQAPFYVLIGAQMPSILAEISFINHKVEGRRLADPAYRQLVAQALADGVKRYVKSVKTAALAPPAPAEAR